MTKVSNVFFDLVNIGYSLIFLLFTIKIFNGSETPVKLILMSVIFALIQTSVPLIKIKDKCSEKIIRTVMICVFVLLQAAFFMTVAIPSGWDSEGIRLFAVNGLECGWGRYFAQWPNNSFTAMVTHIWMKIAGIIIPFIPEYSRLILLNIIVVDAALVCAYYCVKILFDTITADRFAICGMFCVGLSPWLEIVYTDTLASLFPILFLFLILMTSKVKSYKIKIVLLFFAFFMVVVGYNIKPTVIISAIAFAIVAIIKCNFKPNRKIFVNLIVVAVACLSATTMVNIINIPLTRDHKNNYPEEKARGVYYFVDTGLAGFGTGYWNEEVFTWHKNHISDDNYEEQAVSRIKDKVKSYGVVGMAEHMYKKMLIAGSDGTFSFGGEGNFYLEEPADPNTLKGKLQNYIYVPSDFYQNWLRVWLQAVWLAVCMQNALSVFYRPDDKNKKDFLTLSKLAVGGLFVFLMIFENRSRYIFLYLPVMIMIAQTGVLAIKQKLHKNK